MTRWILALALVLAANLAHAQAADVVVTPISVTAEWRAQTGTTGSLVAAIGLIPCGVPVEGPGAAETLLGVVSIEPPAIGVIVSGTIEVDLAQGDQCFRAVALGANGTLSLLSENSLQVILRPLPPMFLPAL